MSTLLSRRRNHVTALVLSAFILLPFALFSAGCGTSRETANANTQSSPHPYVQSVTAVDETGAAQTLRTISTAQASYAASHGGEYGSFEQLTASGVLDNRFAGSSPERNGYVYTMKLTTGADGQATMYAINADPKTPATGIQTAGRHLYLDSTSGLIHVNNSQSASASDPTFPS